MGLFERFLSLWVALAIGLGVLLGNYFPAAFKLIAEWQIAGVNLLMAALIWLMIYPMMVQVDFLSLRKLAARPQGLFLTLAINWLIKPFTMAALGWLFFKVIFAPFIDPASAQEYIAGVILLGVAPCTAMVFVWSQLTRGDATYTLLQVSVNDLIMVFAYAPICALLLGMSDIQVPWATLLASVGLYVLLPLIAGVLTRQWLGLRKSDRDAASAAVAQLLQKLKPWSILGLLATVVVLFGFQANTLIEKPQLVLLIAIPLLIQTYGIFFLSFYAAKRLRLPFSIAAPACMIGTSNFFELAVAVAIALFGLNSGAALATVVGVLVEVPVMLSLVAYCNRRRDQFLS